MDGWILKPIDFKRLNVILKGVQDPAQRQADVYRLGAAGNAEGGCELVETSVLQTSDSL